MIIPVGEYVILREGTRGFITQALGGSFTVYVEGNLFHVAGGDADALGMEPVPPPEIPENATDAEIESVVWDQLRTCYDPEIPVDIYELGLIYSVDVAGDGRVDVKMTLTSPACPVAGSLPGEVETKVAAVDGVRSAHVELVWDPPWDKDMMSEAAQLKLGFM